MSNTTWMCDGFPSIPNAVLLNDDFCAFQLPHVDVNRARSIVTLPNHETDFLLLERASASVLLCQINGTTATTSRASESSSPGTHVCQSLVRYPGLNHGLALTNDFLYASSDREVVRWPIDLSALLLNNNSNSTDPTSDLILGPEVVVVNNIDESGHTTRTLILDTTGEALYVSVGSRSNVDDNSERSRIRRFNVTNETNFPMDFLTAEVFADGLRNEVGLAFDKHQVLWGVENGADSLQRDDLGQDIYEDNPGEELNRFPTKEEEGESISPSTAGHYGYPYCWSEFLLDPLVGGLGAGTQWAWPKVFPNNLVYTDEQCRNESLFVRPELSMQAHSAPLGIAFYHWKQSLPLGCDASGAFPQTMDGYAFIAFHGSWNRQVPTGYKVVYVAIDQNGTVQGVAQDLLAHEAPNAQWESGFRPVDVAFDACGRLLVTSDGTNSRGTRIGSMVVRIEYHGNETTFVPNTPSPEAMSELEQLDGTCLDQKHVHKMCFVAMRPQLPPNS